MWIARHAEDLIRRLSRQFPVVYVSGARQAGLIRAVSGIALDLA